MVLSKVSSWRWPKPNRAASRNENAPIGSMAKVSMQPYGTDRNRTPDDRFPQPLSPWRLASADFGASPAYGASGRLVQPLPSIRRYQPPAAKVPPSTGMTWPVTYRDRSLARNTTTSP